jgi:hypothetical protein
MSSIDDGLWGNLHPPDQPGKESTVLKALQGKRLSVRVTLFYTTRRYLPYLPYNASLGYMVGSIGVHDTFPDTPSAGVTYDTANIPGKRALVWRKGFDTPKNLKFNRDDDICRDFSREDIENEKWVNYAPFEVFKRDNGEFEIQLDLSNSIPTDLQNSIRDLGVLQLAVQDGLCLDLIGEPIPYKSADNLYIRGGVHIIRVQRDVTNVPLLLVQVGKYGTLKSCTLSVFAQILLKEEEYLVRPMKYYADHLEKGYKTENTQEVYVTNYGKPAKGVTVSVQYTAEADSGPPAKGVAPTSETATTDEYGVAKFTFKRDLSIKIPLHRQYNNPPACLKSSSYTLPIDGTLYHFYYCVGTGADALCNNDILTYFLAFGDYSPPEQPNWVDDVHPILAQYARLSPMMTKILDMSNYTEVVKGREIMKMSLCNTDFNDRAYMPTTRDLSDEKRKMIVDWITGPKILNCGSACTIKDYCEAPRLDIVLGSNPLFDSSDSTRKPNPGVPECPYPPEMVNPYRYKVLPSKKLDLNCDKEMEFDEGSDTVDSLLEVLREFNVKVDHLSSGLQAAEHLSSGLQAAEVTNIWSKFQLQHSLTDLNLEEFLVPTDVDTCTSVNDLKKILQDAIYLEWATIPVYLTSLYSIIDGCNYEIYELIQSIVREEMLHMTQVANTLIAMNETPKVDDNTVSEAIYKKGRLPGQVLPTLKVTLEKLSLEHVRKVFMMIEVPQNRSKYDKHTIGWFYEKIIDCIQDLKGSGDLSDADFIHRPGLQVKWPRADNNLVHVNSINSAIEGFNMIVEQGEGAGYIQESQAEDGSYSHFYKFEEIVCQKRLEKVGKNKYSYTGNDLPFNKNGVWPMRSNPTVASVPKHSNCYIQSRAFHQVYRLLLRKLQDLFTGADGGSNQKADMDKSLQLMESLQAHAKKLMWVKKRPDCTAACETCGECQGCTHACEKCDQCLACGPVWEYDWPNPTPAPPPTPMPMPTPKEEL